MSVLLSFYTVLILNTNRQKAVHFLYKCERKKKRNKYHELDRSPLKSALCSSIRSREKQMTRH